MVYRLRMQGAPSAEAGHRPGGSRILVVDDNRDMADGIAMLLGRFGLIIPALAIAGSLARKQRVPVTAGTFPTGTPIFGGLVAGVVLIVAGLTFFPALALGPVVEQLIAS